MQYSKTSDNSLGIPTLLHSGPVRKLTFLNRSSLKLLGKNKKCVGQNKKLLNLLTQLPIMKKEGDIKRRYQHPDAVSYTPTNKDGLMLLIKPSFSF